jgi:hypothetical protein
MVLTSNADVVGEADLQRIPSARPKKKDQMLDVFSADTRPRLFFAVFLMGMQQLSGIDGVLYVSLRTSFTSYHSQFLSYFNAHANMTD